MSGNYEQREQQKRTFHQDHQYPLSVFWTNPAGACKLNRGVIQANLAVKRPNRRAVRWCQSNVKVFKTSRWHGEVDTTAVLLNSADRLGVTDGTDAEHVDEVCLGKERLELAHKLGWQIGVLVFLLAGMVEAELVRLKTTVPEPPRPSYNVAPGDLAISWNRPWGRDMAKLDDPLAFFDGEVLVEQG